MERESSEGRVDVGLQTHKRLSTHTAFNTLFPYLYRSIFFIIWPGAGLTN